MEPRPASGFRIKAFLGFTLAFCALLAALIAYLAAAHGQNDTRSFTEPVLSLENGWTLTDGAGVSSALTLPATLPFEADGVYTLSCTLPDTEDALLSPALRFYSNYVDLRIFLDETELYAYPASPPAFNGATGNTYHFVRLPADYAGKTLTIALRGQLGAAITYLIRAPLLGSKATMLHRDVLGSLPVLILAGCMIVLALGLGVLYLMQRRDSAPRTATVFTALFALLFAVYVCCETTLAQLLVPNGYLLCFLTLILLALMPIPLMGVFAESVSRRFKPLTVVLLVLCCLNLIVQTTLNFAGICSVRAMLPATHASIILTITAMTACLFFSDRTEKPMARRTLLSALPMIAGGLTDIVLLTINRPSPNNSFYFTLGVTAFIIIQFFGFIRSYFLLYRAALESRLLRDMAYRDALTGIGNRNAYERSLKERSDGPLTGRLCCVVLDINDLKQINDRFGHQAGDDAIVEVGRILCAHIPPYAACYRTGGDEFVILLDGCAEQALEALVRAITAEAEAREKARAFPLSLAVGYGHYEAADGNLIDFIRRVDTRMYAHKRALKREPTYPFAAEERA